MRDLKANALRAAAVALLGVAAAAVLLSGCGAASRGAATQPPRLDLLIPDCSASFRESSKRLLPEMVEIARDSAARRRVLWAGCFAGAPLRTLAWSPKVDFGELPQGVDPGSPLADRLNQARAIGLQPKLKKIVEDTRAAEPGSGQLEALEMASQTRGVGRVFLFTDAEINEPEAPDLSTATPSEIKRTIDLWAPRLRGLNGVELLLIGVGYGAHNSASVRAGRMLFAGLAKRVGTASFQWTQELPADFTEG